MSLSVSGASSGYVSIFSALSRLISFKGFTMRFAMREARSSDSRSAISAMMMTGCIMPRISVSGVYCVSEMRTTVPSDRRSAE